MLRAVDTVPHASDTQEAGRKTFPLAFVTLEYSSISRRRGEGARQDAERSGIAEVGRAINININVQASGAVI